MLFFTVLGFTKAPPKLKNTGLAQEVISIRCSLLQGDKKSTQQVNYSKTTPSFPKKSY